MNSILKTFKCANAIQIKAIEGDLKYLSSKYSSFLELFEVVWYINSIEVLNDPFYFILYI